MAEQVFGLGVNQVMAYAAVANVLLVVVLAGINVYYAVHAKRQADASREQVAVFTRQAEIAAETLSFLRKQIDQQVRTDVAAVALQLKVAIHVIEDWLKRIARTNISNCRTRSSSCRVISTSPPSGPIRSIPLRRKIWALPRCMSARPKPT